MYFVFLLKYKYYVYNRLSRNLYYCIWQSWKQQCLCNSFHHLTKEAPYVEEASHMLFWERAISSAVEHLPYKQVVIGSNPIIGPVVYRGDIPASCVGDSGSIPGGASRGRAPPKKIPHKE